MEVQKTALYNIHKNLGAKFVPFAGYEMPIQYKEGIVKEHISTRTYAGFFDVSHMGQFFLEGDETLTEALEKIINELTYPGSDKPVGGVGIGLYITMFGIENDLKIIEIPITFNRRIGRSKLTGAGVGKTIKIGLRFLWLILVS